MAKEITYLRCSRVRAVLSYQQSILPSIEPHTSPFLLLLPPQLMKYKQYANMVNFLHRSCGNDILETGIGAAPSGKDSTSSKDGFLWTLALHLHRLQRYAAKSNPACKIAVMWVVACGIKGPLAFCDLLHESSLLSSTL